MLDKNMINLLMGFQLYKVVDDDPEDTLFLTLTQKEVIVMGIALITLGLGAESQGLMGLNDDINALRNKLADSMGEQKGALDGPDA